MRSTCLIVLLSLGLVTVTAVAASCAGASDTTATISGSQPIIIYQPPPVLFQGSYATLDVWSLNPVLTVWEPVVVGYRLNLSGGYGTWLDPLTSPNARVWVDIQDTEGWHVPITPNPFNFRPTPVCTGPWSAYGLTNSYGGELALNEGFTIPRLGKYIVRAYIEMPYTMQYRERVWEKTEVVDKTAGEGKKVSSPTYEPKDHVYNYYGVCYRQFAFEVTVVSGPPRMLRTPTGYRRLP